MKITKDIIRQQVDECITEISSYSTVWNEKRVIIFPINYRKVLSISIDKNSAKEFNYNEVEKATEYINSKL